MNIAIWVIQGILALMFGMAGVMKSTQAKEKLEPKMPWMKEYSAGMVKFVGVSELLGAIGLIVPLATGIVPILTPLAAVGLALIMVLAMAYHMPKGEYKETAINAVLLILCAAVAYFRF